MTFHLPLIGTIAIVIVVIDAGSHSCWSYYWLLLLRHSYYVSQNSIGSFSSVIIIMYPKRRRRGSFPTFFWFVMMKESGRFLCLVRLRTVPSRTSFFFATRKGNTTNPISPRVPTRRVTGMMLTRDDAEDTVADTVRPAVHIR